MSAAVPSSAPARGLSVFSLSVPVAMGYVPLGAVFGFLLVQAGATWWLPPAASLLVFAGAAQFMMIPMLAAGASIEAIVAATAIVNLRHIFYGISLLDRMPSQRLAKAYLMWVLTDENYSVITTLPKDASSKQMVCVAMLNHAWWVLGALTGAVIGAQVSHSLTGLDFSLAALFAVLTVEQWRATRRATPIVVAIASYLLTWWLVPTQTLLSSIALSLTVGLLMLHHHNKKTSR